jgi:hypothetical protein
VGDHRWEEGIPPDVPSLEHKLAPQDQLAPLLSPCLKMRLLGTKSVSLYKHLTSTNPRALGLLCQDTNFPNKATA